jgi:hypothetical protein
MAEQSCEILVAKNGISRSRNLRRGGYWIERAGGQYNEARAMNK